MNHLLWCGICKFCSVERYTRLRIRIADTVILSRSRILPMTVKCFETCPSLLVSISGSMDTPRGIRQRFKEAVSRLLLRDWGPSWTSEFRPRKTFLATRCMVAWSGFRRRVGLFTSVKVDLGRPNTRSVQMRTRVKGRPCSGGRPSSTMAARTNAEA